MPRSSVIPTEKAASDRYVEGMQSTHLAVQKEQRAVALLVAV